MALTNDGGQRAIVKRCVKVCDPPDTERWWVIKPGDLKFIHLHEDSGVLVVLTPMTTLLGAWECCDPVHQWLGTFRESARARGRTLRQPGLNKLDMIHALLDYTESFVA